MKKSEGKSKKVPVKQNVKRIAVAIAVLVGVTATSVFALGNPTVRNTIARSEGYKQCDCECQCSYCLSGECTFKAGSIG